jgi:ferredoxin
MTHIITSLCLRDAACILVCPVECIVPGQPINEWPWMYIDPDTCIDCGACIPECPYAAIFTEDDVPAAYQAKGGERLNAPGDPNFSSQATEPYKGHDHENLVVILEQTVSLPAGAIVNLRGDIRPNYDFFKDGPGYKAVGR